MIGYAVVAASKLGSVLKVLALKLSQVSVFVFRLLLKALCSIFNHEYGWVPKSWKGNYRNFRGLPTSERINVLGSVLQRVDNAI